MKRLRFLMLALMLPLAASAQNFSTTNLQLLYGTGFDDWHYGNNTESGGLGTLTFEHFTAFSAGDLFVFADLTRGEFVDATQARLGVHDHFYSELGLRLSPLKLAGAKPSGLIRDVLVAGQVVRDGTGFTAGLIGAGADFDVPGFQVASVNVYYRDDRFNAPTYQVTTVWAIPFNVAGAGLRFEGFLDVAGTDALGTDWLSQPQVLLDLKRWPFQVGAELYLHHNDALSVVAPQALVKWVL